MMKSSNFKLLIGLSLFTLPSPALASGPGTLIKVAEKAAVEAGEKVALGGVKLSAREFALAEAIRGYEDGMAKGYKDYIASRWKGRSKADLMQDAQVLAYRISDKELAAKARQLAKSPISRRIEIYNEMDHELAERIKEGFKSRTQNSSYPGALNRKDLLIEAEKGLDKSGAVAKSYEKAPTAFQKASLNAQVAELQKLDFYWQKEGQARIFDDASAQVYLNAVPGRLAKAGPFERIKIYQELLDKLGERVSYERRFTSNTYWDFATKRVTPGDSYKHALAEYTTAQKIFDDMEKVLVKGRTSAEAGLAAQLDAADIAKTQALAMLSGKSVKNSAVATGEKSLSEHGASGAATTAHSASASAAH